MYWFALAISPQFNAKKADVERQMTARSLSKTHEWVGPF